MSQSVPPAEAGSPNPAKPSVPVALPPPGPTLKRRAVGVVGKHFRGLSRWKKALLILAIVIAATGFVGVLAGAIREKPAEQTSATVTVEQLQGVKAKSSLTPEQAAQLEQAKQKVREVSHWFYDKTAPNLWKWGISFAVMFVLGYAFRQFIKTMASLAAIVLVGAGIAAYFGYINLSEVKTNLTSGTGWLMDQMTAIKELVVRFLGASLVGTAGFVIGFLRR